MKGPIFICSRKCISYTVIGVGGYAFYNAKDLTGVTFPTVASFTYIGKYDSYQYCFNNCSNLKGKLVIPDNVKYTAQYTPKDREYTISFVNYNDAPLWSGKFKYNK